MALVPGDSLISAAGFISIPVFPAGACRWLVPSSSLKASLKKHLCALAKLYIHFVSSCPFLRCKFSLFLWTHTHTHTHTHTQTLWELAAMAAECVWCQGSSLVRQWRWVIASKNTVRSHCTQSVQRAHTHTHTQALQESRQGRNQVQCRWSSFFDSSQSQSVE